MGLMRKASLLLYFLFFLHLLHAIRTSSTTGLASVDPHHDNIPVQFVEFAVVVNKSGGRSGFGGGGRKHGCGGKGCRGRAARRRREMANGGSYHRGNRSHVRLPGKCYYLVRFIGFSGFGFRSVGFFLIWFTVFG